MSGFLNVFISKIEIVAKNYVFLLNFFHKCKKFNLQFFFYYTINYDSWLAVFTYNINKNDVGIIINKAVAINPRIFTSIMSFFNIIFI